MVIGQHKPVPIWCGADQRHPKGRRVGEVADRGAFGGAHPLDLLIGHRRCRCQLDIPPGRHGIGRDDLHRLVELFAESGRQVGMAVDHGVHRIAQPVGVERAGHGDVQLHRIHVVGAVRGAGVEEQSLLQGGQRQDIGDPVLLLQLVDLLLAQPGGGDIRRGQPAAAVSDMGADAGQGVKPQLAQPADLRVIQCRGRPRPVGVQSAGRCRCRRCRR